MNSDLYIYDSKSNLEINSVDQGTLVKSILPAQSAEWPAAQTGGDPKIRIQREPAIAFGLGHRHQAGIHKIHRRVGVLNFVAADVRRLHLKFVQ